VQAKLFVVLANESDGKVRCRKLDGKQIELPTDELEDLDTGHECPICYQMLAHEDAAGGWNVSTVCDLTGYTVCPGHGGLFNTPGPFCKSCEQHAN